MKSLAMTHRVFPQVFLLSTLWLTALTTSAASATTPNVSANETLAFSLAVDGREEGSDADTVNAVILVANPGDGNDIKPAIEAAISSASAGDTIVIPAGEFRFEGEIVIPPSTLRSLHIKGQGKNKTKLYRSSDGARRMFTFYGSNNPGQVIEISNIWFQGTEPSRELGDGKSEFDDYCLCFSDCVGFKVHHNRFEYFGHVAIGVVHTDTTASGLIYYNEFKDNYKKSSTEARAWTCGYGVVVGGSDDQWIVDPSPGSANFIFVEDNYFEGHRHAIAGAGGGLYVFRSNLVLRSPIGQAVDAHGGGKYGNDFSTRFYEVYDNVIINTHDRFDIPLTEFPEEAPPGYPDIDGHVFPDDYACDRLTYRAMALRGGEGLIFNNYIDGFRHGITLQTEISGDYPVPHQMGYASGQVYGSGHTGTDPNVQGKGDVFIRNNTYNESDVPCYHSDVRVTFGPVEEDRDYHDSVERPNYSPYAYPHPGRSQGIQYTITIHNTGDNDSDGLSNLDEFFHDTDPGNSDTDGDEASDGDEVIAGTDPTVPTEFPPANSPLQVFLPFVGKSSLP